MVLRTLYRSVFFNLRKVFRNYNVIERADKILDAEKRPLPPRHPSVEKKGQYIIKTSPEVKEELSKKRDDLLDRLKSMKIESSSEPVVEEKEDNKPQDRMYHGIPKFGYDEPQVIPPGKCTLEQAMNFLTSCQNESDKWTANTIAEKYNMKPLDIENVVKYFKVFEIYIPYDKKKKTPSELNLHTLGVGKIKKATYKKKYAHLEGVKKEDMEQVEKLTPPTDSK